MRLSERLVYYSKAEELANRLTHGLGALAGVVGFVILMKAAFHTADPWRITSSAIYGTGLVTFYTLSTLYHTVRTPGVRYVFRILDHASIFLMIAGTYTPFTLVSLNGAWGWSLFGTVWGLALVGMTFKAFMPHRLRIVAPLLYIGLGWLVIIAIKPLLVAVPLPGVLLLVAGGVAYTLGVLFYAIERIPFNHAIWHLFVLAGSFLHYLAIYLYVVPMKV
ncbi:hemolysin III family protein [Desulfuromonas sp. AOP6]|uniref:PAQR family membrane homeostasis protein TrhA n=1 Tax=Desulfuromonas sp. AOP6 TaxID=1566351 RepID=UPI001273F892|nr:hemolysin III family protein [Desulfuromonas sp. AOP6]BCA79692.1 hemolysin D [Desulfuromonas sp. AOP6]